MNGNNILRGADSAIYENRTREKDAAHTIQSSALGIGAEHLTKKMFFFSSRLTFDTTAARKDTWLRFELNCLAKSFCWILLHLLQPNADDMKLLSGDHDSHHETY